MGTAIPDSVSAGSVDVAWSRDEGSVSLTDYAMSVFGVDGILVV